jgi:tetratricopeptide (TPR) repeat protein
MTYDANGKNLMLGSGVVWEDGVVATNCHVLKNAHRIQVESQNLKYPAIPMQSDWDRDICSLAVKELKGQTVTKGSTSRLQVGDKVYAVGAPHGLKLTLSDGLISSLRPVVGGQYLQISAPISSGSSGGGLFDEEGRLIGLPTFYLAESQQLNFAVPVEWVNELPKRSAPAPKLEQTTSNEWLNKAVELEMNQNWKEMLDWCRKWTISKPGDADAWYILGIASVKTKQAARAIEAYQQAIRINPDYVFAWYNLGFTYAETKQTAKAIESFKQAIRINPDYADAWNSIGTAYIETKQAARAIEAYQQAIRINPDYVFAWNNIGKVYAETKQTAKAIESFKQTIRINQDDNEAWYSLGVIYGETKQAAKAVEAYQQAIRVNPDDADAWYNLGVAYKNSHQIGNVTEVYKRLKTIDRNLAEKYFIEVVKP